MASPSLPTHLDRYAIDAHYSDLVNTLRAGGSPAAVAAQAHHQFLNQFRTAHPQVAVPTYLRNLGHDEEDPNAPQAPPTPAKRPATTTLTGNSTGNPAGNPTGDADPGAGSGGPTDDDDAPAAPDTPASEPTSIPADNRKDHPGEPCATAGGR